MIMNGNAGSSGSGGLNLIYFAQSVYNQVTLGSPGKLAIVTTNVLSNSGTCMVVPGSSQVFGQLYGNNRTVSFSPDGMTVDIPDVAVKLTYKEEFLT